MSLKQNSQESLSALLGYRFRQPKLLEEALMHRSALDRRPGHERFAYANERLEFLGDRVLALVVAELLLERFPDDSEGALAKRHAALVRAEILAEVAAEIGLGDFLNISVAERASGGAEKPTILSDACEALLGALYEDGGLEPAAAFIHRHWSARLDSKSRPPADAKTALQEWAQGRGLPLPVYAEVGREGPDHAPEFVIEVAVKGHPAARGTGRTKRAAERDAATRLLQKVAP